MTLKRQRVEMVDGRVYYSEDGWETVWKSRWPADGFIRVSREVTGKEADRARFLWAMQAGAGA